MGTTVHAGVSALAALVAGLGLAACGPTDAERSERLGTASPAVDARSSAVAVNMLPDRAATGTLSGSGTAAAPGVVADPGEPAWTVVPAGPGAAADAGPGEAAWTVARVAAGAAAAAGPAATTALPSADAQFVTHAAENGQFELEIARLATERAADPLVKAFAQMLVDDHTAANDRLRRIASSHDVALPASLRDDRKKQLDELGKLSGAEFDRQFVKAVGIDDHRHEIAAFEKAAQGAQNDDVRSFAQSALPILKKHLTTAERLPGAKPRG